MKNLKEKLFFLSFVMFSTLLTAQGLKIKGTVVDAEDQMPLIGANILIQGTNTGAATDFDGGYSITASPGDILVFSYLGYQEFKITVGDAAVIDAKLVPSADALDAVVVIGYGTTTKKDLTGSVASVKSEIFKERPVVTMEDALQGNAPGLLIQSSGGQPGAAANINIRGVGSLSGSNQPLIVIDGFPIAEVATSGGGGLEAFSAQMSAFAFIDPNDIESVEVLKDASATAIYGVRGANGVILITSKKGKKGKTKISYNTYMGVRNVPKQLDVLNFSEFASYIQDRAPGNVLFSNNDVLPPTPFEFEEGVPSINWQDRIYRTGIVQNHSLSVQGGAENTSYRLSGSYLQDKSVIIATDFKKYNAKLSIDQKISDKLKFGTTLSYNYIFNNGVPTDGREGTAAGAVMTAITASPYQIQDPDTQAYFRRAGTNQLVLNNYSELGGGGPENLARNTDIDKSLSRFIVNGWVNYDITDKLAFKMYAGSDMFNGKDQQFYPTNTPTGRLTQGQAVVAEFLNRSWLNENIFTYKNQFYNHKINIVFGFTQQENHWEWNRTQAITFENELLGYNQLSNASDWRSVSDVQDLKLHSLLSRFNYTFKDKFNLTLSVRRDGTSRFKDRWKTFPSAAIAYNLGEENFLKNSKAISMMKFRVSAGETGNANVPTTGAFAQLKTSNYNFDGQEVLGLSPANLANEALSWETSQQVNGGIDLSLFQDKVSITADYYIKRTKDLILNVPISLVSGFPSAWKNVGELENRGVELSINTINVKTSNFEWSSNFNGSYNKSNVNKLDDDGAPIYVNVLFNNTMPDEIIIQEGGAIGDLYGYVQEGLYLPSDYINGVDGALLPTVPSRGITEKPGEVKFKDLNNDGVISPEDRTVIGNTLPDVFGSVTNNFTYKGFDLNVMLQYSIGNDVFNATRTRTELFTGAGGNQSTAYLNRWTPSNSTSSQYSTFTNMQASSTFVEDASFLRIKNVRVGYNLPKSLYEKLNITNIKLYASADNLAVFTKYSGYDPEISSNVGGASTSRAITGGFDYGGFPRARTYTLGLNVDF